ncbi:Basic 7S globulin 2 [Glycine soja]
MDLVIDLGGPSYGTAATTTTTLQPTNLSIVNPKDAPEVLPALAATALSNQSDLTWRKQNQLLLHFANHFMLSPNQTSNEFPKTGYISLPINIDPTTHQHFTSIGIGTPRHNMNLAIDLSGSYLWYDCGGNYNSSSYNPVPWDSPQCPGPEPFQSNCDAGFPFKPGCTNNTCNVALDNPFADFGFGGDLGHDFLFTPQIKLPQTFFSVCSESSRFPQLPILVGLPKSTKGSLGLARQSPFTLQSQISSSFNNVPPKFTLCLPSSGKKGHLFIGGKPTFSTPLSQIGFDSRYSNYDYFFHLNSIHINHKPVQFNTSGLSVDLNDNVGTKISTLHPFTVLHPQVYQPFVKAFVKAAKTKNMKRVKKVHPFGTCYDATTVGDHREAVPDIDLVLEAEELGRFGKVSYEIYGHDSLVEVKKGVLCLAFVNGGIRALDAVLLGAHQLKDRILVFDESTSIISFSSSLCCKKGCSALVMESIPWLWQRKIHYNSSSYNPVPWDSPQCPHPEAYLSNCDSGLPFTALISSSFNVPPKFTLCLPSSGKKGHHLFIGGGPTLISTSLSQTGFGDGNFSNYEYAFHLNSININHKPVKFNTSDIRFLDGNGNAGAIISAIQPYTVLHRSVYQLFVKVFVKAEKAKNMKRVKKVHPFGTCYDANTIADVPAIDLVLESRIGKGNYDISGHDSLVEVRKGVMCLAFADGGKQAFSGVLLGGHQLKDRILEFDLTSNEFPKTGFITLPINIDSTTPQYFTSVCIGTQRHNMNLAIDLSGNYLWYECDSHYNSSSYNPVTCVSPHCPQGSPCLGCDGSPRKPGCTNDTCGFDVVNPFSDSTFIGDMGHDFLFLPQIKLPQTFVYGCAETSRFSSIPILSGLAKGIKGILGLARTPHTLPFQISSSFNVPPKFTLCLPSSGKGKLFIGGRPSSSIISLSQTGFGGFSSTEYFIHVNSITINDKPVKFGASFLFRDENGNGGSVISTMSPYTVLHHSIYKPFVRDFVEAATAKNIKRVKSVHPFGECFDANTIKDGKAVPDIKLAMDGRFRKVSYGICAHNSLVEVRKGVLCLAFVDGGEFAVTGVVLDGHQLRDRVLEFDLNHSTHQYLTILSYGTPVESAKFVLDLGGSLLWADCASRTTPSSTLAPIFHRSIRCLTAKGPEIETHRWLSSLANPIDQDQPCQITAENSITGKRVTEGELVEDLVIHRSHELLFTCSPTFLLNGLATDAKGIIGLDKSRISFSSQVFHSLKIQRKITLCLSPTSGVIQFGKMTHKSQTQSEIFRSLTFTPLVANQDPTQTQSSINVNSVKINGKKVAFDTPLGGGAQLSTVVPYTTLQTSIYDNFESAYLKAASSMDMKRVDPVSPFGLCFESNGVGSSQVGPNVPIIDLVLQSEMVKWSIYGRNSMVQVSDDVMCLGFVDGGENPRNSIVIGGFQLEDVLMQIDFDTSMVGFSPSLLTKQASCSDFQP